jgi:hypothetical protein
MQTFVPHKVHMKAVLCQRRSVVLHSRRSAYISEDQDSYRAHTKMRVVIP